MCRNKQNIAAGPIWGYKAFNQNLTCKGYQFSETGINELGNDDDLVACKNGFHFCVYPSGVYAYYSNPRVFKIKAWDVLIEEDTPGADCKKVCRKLELIEEIKPDGSENTGFCNTGNRNTGGWNTGDKNTGSENTGDKNTGEYNAGGYNAGDWNTGNRNTGDWNTGDKNTGNGNAGDYNVGNRNTGEYNTGDWNTGNGNAGDWNAGDYNAGDYNAGDYNVGNRNTGDYNTGSDNTGIGNVGDKLTGYFNSRQVKLRMFDAPIECDESEIDYDLVYNLSESILSDDDFDTTPFLSLPNATDNKIKALHKRHIKARKKLKAQRQKGKKS